MSDTKDKLVQYAHWREMESRVAKIGDFPWEPEWKPPQPKSTQLDLFSAEPAASSAALRALAEEGREDG